jgi:hypothetical protein
MTKFLLTNNLQQSENQRLGALVTLVAWIIKRNNKWTKYRASNSTKTRHSTKIFTTVFKLKAQSKFTAEPLSSSAIPKIKHKKKRRA